MLYDQDLELGSIARLTAGRVRDAGREIVRGEYFNLDLPLKSLPPSLARHRTVPDHVIFQHSPNHRDDYLERFYLQSGSHVDGLRHVRHPQDGFFGGVPEAEISPDTSQLGVQHWAQHGIVGRGVLVDIGRHRERQGVAIDDPASFAITADDLEGALAATQTTLKPGDILLLRTGWLRSVLDSDNAASLVERSPGLAQSHRTLEWLSDNKPALVAADNLAVEAYPPVADKQWLDDQADKADGSPDDPLQGLLHSVLIPVLGLALGELWWLEELAGDCAQDGRYTAFVSSKPLNIRGAVGSPANAFAIK